MCGATIDIGRLGNQYNEWDIVALNLFLFSATITRYNQFNYNRLVLPFHYYLSSRSSNNLSEINIYAMWMCLEEAGH